MSEKPSVLSVHIPEFLIKDKKLLSDIHFELKDKELLVILGKNGAGKSTLLKHISGEIRNEKNNIQIFFKKISSFKSKELAQRRAVLTQTTPLNFSYEVLEVVLLGRIPHQRRQLETEEDVKIAQQCLERVGLQGYETRNYLTLSGGEQQRVHLARVLAQIWSEDIHSDIEKLLLLDEPTSSLDIAHQHQTLRVVKSLLTQNVSCMAILHDLNLASQYADKVLILEDGKMVAYGTPKEVLTAEILTKAYGHKIHVMAHPYLECALII